MYDAVEELAGLKGPDLVFIDDRADNVAAAAARGWRAVHHHTGDAARTLRLLRDMGLPVVDC